jgi:hypothetical protein
MSLKRGMAVRFRPCSEQWAMGYRRGIVVAVDKSAAAFFREMGERMPELLGDASETALDRIKVEGDRTGVIVRGEPTAQVPLGLEMIVPEDWIEETEGGPTMN